MNQIIKKYVICLIFSFDLFVLVWLSEMLRPIVLAVSSGLTSGIPLLIAYVSGIFFLFVFGIIPAILLAMWLISPIPIKKLLVQFGLNEKLLDKKPKKDNDDNSIPSHDQIRYAILTILYRQAEKNPNFSVVERTQLIELLKLPEKTIDFNVHYLAKEKLIDLTGEQHIWHFASINSSGINAFEHKEENKTVFPFLNATIPIQIQNKIGIINL